EGSPHPLPPAAVSRAGAGAARCRRSLARLPPAAVAPRPAASWPSAEGSVARATLRAEAPVAATVRREQAVASGEAGAAAVREQELRSAEAAAVEAARRARGPA